jgi:hypothetical protein
MHDYYCIGRIVVPASARDRTLDRGAIPPNDPTARRVPVPGVVGLVGDGAGADHCFSDEIIVDFPSMQEAVARIRASFLAS